MLNIGFGSGRESLALHQLEYQVVGVDIELTELVSARQTLPQSIPLFCIDGLRLPFADTSLQHVTIWD